MDAAGAAAREQIDAGAVAEWRDRRLSVQNAPVSAVVVQLRPYVQGWIIVSDPALAERRVTGLYDLSDPHQAMQALVAPAGGRVRQLTPFLYVLSSS
jgi:transmembrane sensor